MALALGRDWVLANVEARPGMTRPWRAADQARRQGRRPHLHRGQPGRRARCRLRRRHRMRVVSAHPIVVARRRVHDILRQAAPRQGRQGEVRHHPGRGRNRFHRHRGRRRLERRPRLHGDLRPPAISLMQEFSGLAYFAEIPAVIFDVQRAGPSTGMPTRTQQSDVLNTAYASHGDTKHVVLFPQDPGETFAFSALSFDLAERLQTPIFVLLDLEIGMNQHLTAPLKWDDRRRYDRGKIMTAADLDAGKDFGRYLDVDGDGIPFRTLPGTPPTRGSYFTRGTSRDRYAPLHRGRRRLRRQHAAPVAQVRDRQGPGSPPAPPQR